MVLNPQGQLTEAREGVIWLADLQSRFPQLLAALRPSVHVLAGQYALNTREWETAVLHLTVGFIPDAIRKSLSGLHLFVLQWFQGHCCVGRCPRHIFWGGT